MRNLIALLFLFLSACSTPANIKSNVANIIPPGACYDFYVKGGLGTYQHNAQMFNPKAAFALAMDDNKSHVCGAASRKEVCDDTWTTDCTWEKVEALAISRCELFREQGRFSVKSSCKPFARNNEIVWDSYKNEKFELQ